MGCMLKGTGRAALAGDLHPRPKLIKKRSLRKPQSPVSLSSPLAVPPERTVHSSAAHTPRGSSSKAFDWGAGIRGEFGGLKAVTEAWVGAAAHSAVGGLTCPSLEGSASFMGKVLISWVVRWRMVLPTQAD